MPPSSSAASSLKTIGPRLREIGIAAIYTPKDYEIAGIMRDVAELAVSPPRRVMAR